MHVVDLRDFYATPLGQFAGASIGRKLRKLAAPGPGQTVMGLGYAPPYLETLSPGNPSSLAFMPARQGVIHWPMNMANQSALVDACELPLLESVIDLALVIHGLEFADAPDDMLHEVWRVLGPQGRLILVVPNRRGVWAASEKTPFGHGQPFSPSQLGKLLKDTRFTITRWESALRFPPLRHRTALAMARHVEAAGQFFSGTFSGVTIVEAVKQVYAFSSGKRSRRLVPRLRPVLLPAPQGLGKSDATIAAASGSTSGQSGL